MEPNYESAPNPNTQGGPERLPSNPDFNAPEQLPHRQPEQMPTPEQGQERGQESREQQTGLGRGDNPPQQQMQPQSLPTPVAPLPTPPSTETSSGKHPANENPLIADDVDVIEKEWVDRTKKILQETKDDPHQKEHEISHLQADYLEKRFGVQVKLPQG